jgi:uroporphyrinogen-III synthase
MSGPEATADHDVAGTDPSECPAVAIFRPDDERLDAAIEILRSLGADPVPDPMLDVAPTGATPEPADHLVLTSRTAADLLADAGWPPAGDTTVWAIGPATAEALRAVGIAVDRLPETYSSAGLVEAMHSPVTGESVEVARSDHGTDALLDGLRESAARVHETVLYRLERPAGAGTSIELAAAGAIDAALFTSSLTVEHAIEAGAERGIDEPAAAFDGMTVGAIGAPTRETAEDVGIEVDVVPAEATFEALAQDTVDATD